jgi:hypothetical protein
MGRRGRKRRRRRMGWIWETHLARKMGVGEACEQRE